MTAVQFSGSSSSADRRRRFMATDYDPATTEPQEPDAPTQHDFSGASEAFPMLSRDRLIRRVISPRIWKHVTVAILLTLGPVIYAIITWHWADDNANAAGNTLQNQINGLRGFSGIKLFAAGQFCLLIAWVRSASPVDFKGRFRWWRWLGLVLFAISVVTLTNSSEWLIDGLARCLHPILGPIDSARPALLFVPFGAFLAVVLRHVIPDMGRCRTSQSLVVTATILLAVRSFAGARLHTSDAAFHLGTLELLISGLVLSAVQFHARFVIHVNPNPPIAVERQKPAAAQKKSGKANPTPQLAMLETADAAHETTTFIKSEIVPSIDTTASDDCTQLVEAESNERKDSIAVPAATVARDTAIASELAESQPAKHKSGKKQKLRRAG